MLSMARTISPFCASSPPTKVFELRDEVLDVAGAATERVVELDLDGLQLGDATAVEQQRHRAEDLLDLGVAAGARQRDAVAVAEPALGRRVGRGGERDVLLAEQARSA